MDYRNQTIELKNKGLDFFNRQVDGERFQDAQWIDPDADYVTYVGNLDVTPSKAASGAKAWKHILPPLSGANKPVIVEDTGAAFYFREVYPTTGAANYDLGLPTSYPPVLTSVDVTLASSKRVRLIGSTDTAGANGDLRMMDEGTVTRGEILKVPFNNGINSGQSPTVTTATVSGAAGGILNNSTAGMPGYQWRCTFYDSLRGRETPASRSTAAALSLTNQAGQVTLDLSTGPWTTYNAIIAEGYDKIRLYRKGGAVIDGYRLSQEWTIPAGVATTVVFTDALGAGAVTPAGLNDIALSVAKKLNENQYWAFYDYEVYTSGATGAPTSSRAPLDPVLGSWKTNGQYTNAYSFFGPFKGDTIFAFGNPKPQRVSWTTPGAPFTWDPNINFINVCPPEESVRGGVVYNGVPYVFTESNCYALDFGGTDALPAFKPRITSIGIGVLNHSSVISLGPQGVILINQSGIYITDCEQQIERISDYGIQNFFTGGVPAGADGDDNNNVLEVYDPTQLQESAAFYKGKLFVSIPIKSTTYSAPTWTVTQTRRSFVYSPIKQNWSYLYIDISVGSISAFLTDASGANEYLWCLTNSTNLANDAGSQYWGALGVFVPANIFGSTSVQPVIKIRNNTGAEANLGVIYGIQLMPLSMGIPNTYKEFSSVLIDLEVHPYGAGSAPVCTIGGVAKTLSIGRQTSLHTLATEFAQLKDLSVGLSNQRVTLYNLTILYREDEEALTLWEIPPTANALQGWHMYKGAYITLRSSAITQLIVQADEQAADTYEIASTGGTKKKIYVGFLPKKGKVWNFKFQTKSPAVTPFRLYGEDSEFLVKSWGSRGWQVANPLTASGYAGFLRKGGGT